MARGLDLRQYQEEILAKLGLVAKTTLAVSVSRLGVMVGKNRVLVDLAEISEVSPLPEMHGVPLTQPWFLGMANVRGNLYGVNDLAQLSGQAPILKTSNCRVLLVNQELVAQTGLVVENLIGLRSLDQFKVKKVKKARAFCFKPQEYEDSDGNIWFELDCRALTDSKEFMQPSIG